ncbi:MAG: rhodanese-like domain-containing protein, partial [Pseudonocardiaceae bacterium]
MSRADVLVTPDWAEQNLNTDGIVFVEVDEDTTAYDTGHIPGAVKINWKTELQDPVIRDFVDKGTFEKLLSNKGISSDDTVVLY